MKLSYSWILHCNEKLTATACLVVLSWLSVVGELKYVYPDVWKNPARIVETSTILVMSAIYLLLLRRQTQKDDVKTKDTSQEKKKNGFLFTFKL